MRETFNNQKVTAVVADDHPLFRDGLVRALTGSGLVDVVAEGDGDLAQLFDLMFVGDMVSLHLAAAEGIDPGPIPALEDLKRQLADGTT